MTRRSTGKTVEERSAYWRERIAEQERSGMSVQQFCKEKGIPEFKRFANKAMYLRPAHRAINHLLAISAGQNHPEVGADCRCFANNLTAGRPWNRHIQQNGIDSVPVRAQQIDRSSAVGSLQYLKTSVP
jgi:hypothetical protein